MRFAWLRKNAGDEAPPPAGCITSPVRMVYNAIFWVFVLPFVNLLDYRTGFIAFAVVIALRLAANLYLNNVLSPEQAASFPFRA